MARHRLHIPVFIWLIHLPHVISLCIQHRKYGHEKNLWMEEWVDRAISITCKEKYNAIFSSKYIKIETEKIQSTENVIH